MSTLIATQAAHIAAASALIQMRRKMANTNRLANPLTTAEAFLLAESGDEVYTFFSLNQLMDEAIQIGATDAPAANKLWGRLAAMIQNSVIHPDNIGIRTMERFAKACPLTYSAKWAFAQVRARRYGDLPSSSDSPAQLAA